MQDSISLISKQLEDNVALLSEETILHSTQLYSVYFSIFDSFTKDHKEDF